MFVPEEIMQLAIPHDLFKVVDVLPNFVSEKVVDTSCFKFQTLIV